MESLATESCARLTEVLAAYGLSSDMAAEIEAQLTLQGFPCGVQQLAKLVSVRPSSVTRWRRSDKYRERVEFYRRVLSDVLRDEYFEKIKLEHGALSHEQCFRHAFRMYVESVRTRQARMGESQPPD